MPGDTASITKGLTNSTAVQESVRTHNMTLLAKSVNATESPELGSVLDAQEHEQKALEEMQRTMARPDQAFDGPAFPGAWGTPPSPSPLRGRESGGCQSPVG